jgi:mono/diheme cytochrome c family protein
MRLKMLLALALAFPLSLARSETLVQSGREIATTFCSRCHAIGPSGESPNPKSPPFRLLSKKYPLSDLQEALGEGIVVGHEGSEMPPFVFSTEQIRALLSYLESIQRK